jgi:hypothetical protein
MVPPFVSPDELRGEVLAEEHAPIGHERRPEPRDAESRVLRSAGKRDGTGELGRILHRDAPIGKLSVDGERVIGLEHEAGESRWVLPKISSFGFAARLVSEKLEIVLSKDRQMIARSERMMPAFGELKTQSPVLIGDAVELTENIDDRMVEDRLHLSHRL